MCHVADGDKTEKKRRKVAEANGTEPAAPDVNGFKAMEVPVVDVVANGEAIQDKMKKKAESQVAVHSQGDNTSLVTTTQAKCLLTLGERRTNHAKE